MDTPNTLAWAGDGEDDGAADRGAVRRPHGQRAPPVGPVDPSFRALSGRLKFTVRRHKFNKYSLYVESSSSLLSLQVLEVP